MRTVLGWGLFVLMAPCPLQVLAAQERTTVGGYGEVHYTNPTGPKTPPVVNLARFVVYLAHSFDDRLAFRSELEVEDAKIEGGQAGGEVALEQAYLDYRLGDWITLRTGLVLPPVGIINETHEPPTFNGVERPGFDHDVIPTTWREIGLGAVGTIPGGSGLAYRVYLEHDSRWQRARVSGVPRQRAPCRWPFGRRGDPGGTPGGPAGELREPVLHGAGRMGAPGREDRRVILVWGHGGHE